MNYDKNGRPKGRPFSHQVVCKDKVQSTLSWRKEFCPLMPAPEAE